MGATGAKILSTPEAMTQVQRMIGQIGGFTSNIGQLNSTGTMLSDPAHWDGPHAAKFRTVWQESYKNLQQAEKTLTDLQAAVQGILTAINKAGGA